MSEMEQRLNAILSNPQLMQQIASMAQAMGTPQQEQPEPQSPAMTPPDPQMLQAVARTLGNTGTDSNQKALLQALSPYLSPYRVQKLERAMQAAKLAGAASGFLSTGGLQMLTGR